MELHPLVWHEWRDDHVLSRRSLIWIDEHADPGDPNPILTAVAQLRAGTDNPDRCSADGAAIAPPRRP